jgi:hypothetical protein
MDLMKLFNFTQHHLQTSTPTYTTTFQFVLSFLTRDLKPFVGVNSSFLDALNNIVLFCPGPSSVI